MFTQGGIFKKVLIILTLTLIAGCSDGGGGGNKINPKGPAAPGEGGDPVVDLSACEAGGGTVSPETGECVVNVVDKACDAAHPCGSDQACEAGVCVAVDAAGPPLGQSCQNDSQCEGNQYCHGQRGCQPKCSVATDCGERETCQDSRCVAWAIDSFPGLADEIAKQNDPEERMKEVKDMLDDGTVNIRGFNQGDGGCWDEFDCKAVENCVGETINGYCRGGFDKGKCRGQVFNEPTEATVPFGFAGHCETDPSIGGVCNDRVPCAAGYSCTGKKAGAPRLSYCEKEEVCPADKPLNADGYCQKPWEETVKAAARIGRTSYCGDRNNIRQVADENMALNVCSSFVHGEKELGECKDLYISEYNKTECNGAAADAAQNACPDGQVFTEGECHVRCDVPKTWNARENRCENAAAEGVADLITERTESVSVVVDTTTENFPANYVPQLELNFCPYFELNGRVDRQAVFEDDECIKKVIDLSVGATRYPNTVSAHVSNRLNFAATDLPLSRFYYFSAKFKHIVVPANGNSPAAVPILTLHGIKVTVNMNVGEDKVYQNPCVQRDLTNNQTSYFSFNDTAVCVRTVVANVESSESFDPIFADIHFTDRNGVLPLRLSEGAFSTPNVSRRGDYHLRFNMNNEERRGYMNSHDRNKTYADYFTLFDINNVASAFQLLKSGSDGLGITNLRVIAFRPSNISDESTTSNECNMYYGNRNLPGSAGDIHLYWLDNEDDEYGNHWVNAFPKQGNQTFAEGRGTTEACIASVNSLSTALNQ